MRDNLAVRTFRGAWSLAGLAAGAAGLATSYFVAMAMTLRESPVVSVANLVIRLTPGWLAHYLIEHVPPDDWNETLYPRAAIVEQSFLRFSGQF